MASTYSDLKIELIGTGEQTGTWGTTTNNNFSIALSEAITGSADVAFSSADVTVTLTDTNAAQTARNLRLNLTGTSGGARQLILGSGCQIEKLYLINNGLADAVTVKNTSGTGIAVPAGKSMFVYNNATNVVDATTYLSSLTLGAALPITSGGTGSTSTTYVNLASNVTGTLPIANGGTGATSAPNAITALGATTLGGNVFTLTNPSAITFPRFNADNTVSSLNAADFRTAIGAGSGAGSVTSVDVSGGTTGLTTSGGPITGSGTITLAGTLAVANGGTGATTLTSGNVLLGSGTSAITASSLLTTSAAVTSGTYIKGIGYADTVVALGNTSTAVNLDVVSGGVFTATLTGNATITLRFPVSSGASSFILVLTNDATPGRTVAWSGGTFLFPGGPGALGRTTTANAIDVWAFFTPNGGTTYYGNIVMKNLAA